VAIRYRLGLNKRSCYVYLALMRRATHMSHMMYNIIASQGTIGMFQLIVMCGCSRHVVSSYGCWLQLLLDSLWYTPASTDGAIWYYR